MKQVPKTAALLLGTFAVGTLAATELTEAESTNPHVAMDAISTNRTTTDSAQCDLPHNDDYLEMLEQADDDLLFAGCGGLI